MSDKAIEQLRKELYKREKYWRDWNGRAANHAAKMESKITDLKQQLDGVRGALQPFVDAYDRANQKESWAASYLNNNAWKAAKQALGENDVQ